MSVEHRWSESAVYGISIAVIGALLLAGCTESAPEKHFPAPVVTNSPVPVDPAIAVTSEQLANSDPCGLLDVDVLSGLGKVEIGGGNLFLWSCYAKISGPGGFATINLDFQSELIAESNGESDPAREYRGVTIYGGVKNKDGSCRRKVAATADAVVILEADGVLNAMDMCKVADLAIEATVSMLLTGDLPPASAAANSLVRQNACSLIKLAEADRIPGIDLTSMRWTYHGQSCTWGGSESKSPVLYVSFTAEKWTGVTGDDPQEKNTTIAGHDAAMWWWDTSDTQLAGCKVYFSYRPLDEPRPYGFDTADNELVNLKASADLPPESTCSTLVDLAELMISRLPSV